MAWEPKKPDFIYQSDPNFKGIEVDEGKSNSFIGIRKIRWNKDSEYKLDLRRYLIRTDGDEVVGKGISFANTDTAHKVTEGLVDLGYGRTSNLLNILSTRKDFEESVASINTNGITESAKDMLDRLLEGEDDES